MPGSRIFINGKIYVSIIPRRVVSGLAVINGRVVLAGDKSEVLELGRRIKAEIIDLGDRTVLPGFIDSHLHLDGIGNYLNTLDLRGVRSIRELKDRLRKYVEEKRDLKWIIGRGWDQELFEEKRWPTRWDLDEVVRDRPVILTRVCGHAAVLNTKAMELTDLLNDFSPDVIRDQNNIATGVVKENALARARLVARSSLSDEDLEKFMIDALFYAASQGVTTAGFVSCDPVSLKILLRLREKISFPIRVRIYLNPGTDPSGLDTSMLDLVKRMGLRRGFGDDYLKILGFKIIADGSLGARTAWLSKPYSDAPETSGYMNIGKEALEKIAKEIDSLGFQLAIHAIGDKTLDVLIEIYSSLKDVSRKRHRIEHASVVRDDQLEKLRELRPVLVTQPHFVISDWWGLNRLGLDRIKWLYRFRDFINNNIPMSISTDAPVEPLNPWETVYAAVTRGEYDNIPYYEYTKDQRLSLEEALYYYTMGSAYAIGEENLLGDLSEGKYADFIVVDKDPFEVSMRELRDLRIMATVVGGEIVYLSKEYILEKI
jgi:predicted amidohydrolase YtcJ